MGTSAVAEASQLPAYAEPPRLGDMGCSWGLRGQGDRLGSLNLLSANRVIAASREIKTGQVFPLDLSMRVPGPPVLGRRDFFQEVRREPGLGDFEHFEDDIVSFWNTQRGSQRDGLRHVSLGRAAPPRPTRSQWSETAAPKRLDTKSGNARA